MTDPTNLLTIVGLTAVTLLTRSFFLLFKKPWDLPPLVQRGLRFAPIAALGAVLLPEIITYQNALITTPWDARPWAVTAAVLFFFWHGAKGQVVLGSMAVGMVVFEALRFGLGWAP